MRHNYGLAQPSIRMLVQPCPWFPGTCKSCNHTPINPYIHIFVYPLVKFSMSASSSCLYNHVPMSPDTLHPLSFYAKNDFARKYIYQLPIGGFVHPVVLMTMSPCASMWTHFAEDIRIRLCNFNLGNDHTPEIKRAFFIERYFSEWRLLVVMYKLRAQVCYDGFWPGCVA